MHSLLLIAFLANIVDGATITELSSNQSSAVRYYFQTLTATRPGVKSIQSAVRAVLPASDLPDQAIGPYFQENFASLLQDPRPVFTTPAWYSSLPLTLQSGFNAYEADALALEKAVIESVVYGAPTSHTRAINGSSTAGTFTGSSRPSASMTGTGNPARTSEIQPFISGTSQGLPVGLVTFSVCVAAVVISLAIL